MKTAESCSASTVMNMSTLSEYAEKKTNVTYVQHSIMMIECITFEMY